MHSSFFALYVGIPPKSSFVAFLSAITTILQDFSSPVFLLPEGAPLFPLFTTHTSCLNGIIYTLFNGIKWKHFVLLQKTAARGYSSYTRKRMILKRGSTTAMQSVNLSTCTFFSTHSHFSVLNLPFITYFTSCHRNDEKYYVRLFHTSS